MKNMRVSIRSFGTLKEILRKREVTLELPEGEAVTVDNVIRQLAELYGKEFKNYVYDDKTGDIKGSIQILINGISVKALNGLKTKLVDGDVLAIILPVGGG